MISVATRTGVFADTDMDRFAEGPDRFYVSYPAGKVRLHARKCAADWNGDAFVNGDDYDAYGELFEAGDPAGDFNNDGFVNGDDYDAFASAFDAADPNADINNDGFVNGDDYDAFASHFEAGC